MNRVTWRVVGGRIGGVMVGVPGGISRGPPSGPVRGGPWGHVGRGPGGAVMVMVLVVVLAAEGEGTTWSGSRRWRGPAVRAKAVKARRRGRVALQLLLWGGSWGALEAGQFRVGRARVKSSGSRCGLAAVLLVGGLHYTALLQVGGGAGGRGEGVQVVGGWGGGEGVEGRGEGVMGGSTATYTRSRSRLESKGERDIGSVKD